MDRTRNIRVQIITRLVSAVMLCSVSIIQKNTDLLLEDVEEDEAKKGKEEPKPRSNQPPSKKVPENKTDTDDIRM